jgi:hypothetical protein
MKLILVLLLPFTLFSATLQIALESDTFKDFIKKNISQAHYLHHQEPIYTKTAGIVALKMGYIDILEIPHSRLSTLLIDFPKDNNRTAIDNYLASSGFLTLYHTIQKPYLYLLAKQKLVNKINAKIKQKN